jgi:hypothetical protein
MSSNIAQKPGSIALLSVAGLTDGQSASSGNLALLEVGGRPLLTWQMLALRRVGVEVFLVEVDTVPGALLDLADGFRRNGSRVEFVRTAKDLQAFLAPDSRLFVQAEAHYFSDAAVEELTKQKTPFVATIDGRDENAAFERIDLNTRWAGFALLDASTALALTELPEGWSIASSLLRQAIQSGVKLRPVPQNMLQRGEVLRVATHMDASTLGNSILSERAETAPGWIEKNVFGAVAKMAAPSIWRSIPSARLLPFVGPAFATLSLALGVFGWSFAALSTGFVALFGQQMSDVVHGTKDSEQPGIWRNMLFWALLVGAAISVAWAERGYLADTPSFMVIAVGLAFLARKIPLQRWSAALLQSPALLSLGLIVAMALSLIPQGVKFTVFAQLGLLLLDRYLPALKGKNHQQA